MADKRTSLTPTPTTATMLPPVAAEPPKARKRGKVPLTPEEKERRALELAAEPHDKRFARLVNHRMPRALKSILAIGNLANKSSYSYTDDQVRKIIDALGKAVQTVSNKFSGNKDNGTAFSI
jgi:hypothetical protein